MSPNALGARVVGVIAVVAVAGAVGAAPGADGVTPGTDDTVPGTGGVASGTSGSVAVGPPPAVGTNGQRDTQASSLAALAPVEGVDDVVVVVRVAADRSAQWDVRYRYRLANGTATAAFERARRNVTNPPGVFVERMRDAARRGEARTGREMAVLNGSVSAFRSVPHGRFGVFEYRVTWTGFATRDADGRLVAGDMLHSYPVEDNESLVLGWTDPLELVDVSPSPNATRESAVRWDGPHDFGVDRPRLVLTKASTGGPLSTVTDPLVLTAVGGLLAAAAVVAVAAGVGTGISADRLLGRATGTDDDGGTDGDGSDSERGDAAGERTPSAELLSDRERVLRLLEDSGGRLKQQDVKEAFDWSRTKTSNVVNDLREEGEIEVYRIGRENTLALPEEMDL